VDYATLPAGVGYDPATNLTRATYRPGTGTDILILTFKNTQRTPDSALNTGVTNIRLMRPNSPGATTSFPIDTLFDPNFKHALERFTTERWLMINNNTVDVGWSDRRLPTWSKVNTTSRPQWETEVMLANETGKDLYLTLPVNATNEYITNLANLIKYGSDGVNPYTSPQTDPVYPGLNSNLRVYVENANEVWNFGFTQTNAAMTAAAAAVAGNTPDGQIINFDGKFPGGDFRRWNALKTVHASDIFRSVFGDASIGDRVRVLYEYQYDNLTDSAGEAFSFLDNYFNNADGIAHVATPHPVSYYIWGAGAAAYFDSPNPRGAQSAIKFTDLGFESPAVPANAAVVAPAGSGWTFTGNAGVYHNAASSPLLAGQSLGLGTNVVAADVMSLGYKFTVGASAVGVYDL
jgi:hypothetical protein